MANQKKSNPTPDTNSEQSLIAPNTKLVITISQETAQKAYQKALNKLAKKVKSAGFRQGKVPAKLAEEILGENKVLDEALQQVVPDAYQKAIEQEKKSPLTNPEFQPLSIKKGEAWQLEAHIAEYPEINIKDYRKITQQAKKEAQQPHDHGQKTSDAKDSKDTKDAKKGEAKKELTTEEEKEHTLHHIYQALTTKIKPAVAELLVKEEVRSDLNSLNQRLQQMKLTFDDFLKQRQMTFEQLSSELAAQAVGRLQLTFILDSIAKAEKMSVEDAEIMAEIDKTEDKKLQKQQKSDPYYQNWLRQTLMRKKLVDHLLGL
jgi:FKBP-type peptidyl-prolyl cis-trans isomerase (trigger factor)